jgi:hypothetical protein
MEFNFSILKCSDESVYITFRSIGFLDFVNRLEF